MGLDDLVDVLRVLVAVPHALGVDDHVGAVLAAVEATRGVAADVLDTQLPRLLAHIPAQFLDAARFRGPRAAAAARMALGPRIGADEDVAGVGKPAGGGGARVSWVLPRGGGGGGG